MSCLSIHDLVRGATGAEPLRYRQLRHGHPANAGRVLSSFVRMFGAEPGCGSDVLNGDVASGGIGLERAQ